MPLPIAAIMAAVQVAGSVAGSVKQAKAKAAAERIRNKYESDVTGRFNNEYYKDFLDTDVARSVLAQQREKLKDFNKNLAGDSLKRGTTTESQIAKAGAAQDAYNNLLTRLTEHGTARKDLLYDKYNSQMGGLTQSKINDKNSVAQEWANWGNSVGNSLNTFGGAASNVSGGNKMTDTSNVFAKQPMGDYNF